MELVAQRCMARDAAPPAKSTKGTRRGEPATGQRRSRVLLVEDNPADARLVAIYLADQPFQLVHAASLTEARRILVDQDPFAAILLDLRLPDSTARSSVEVIREITGDTPIVVVSALESDETVYACLDAGAQDYIRKGEMNELMLGRVLEHAIARAQAADIQRRLERSEQHAVVGRVAAGVAHEVNNLAVVLLSLGDRASELVAALRDRVPEEHRELVAELAAVVDEESRGLHRISDILRELQLFARTDGEQGDDEEEVADVGEVVRQTARLMEGRIRKTARLSIGCAPAPIARISERKLGQIVLNLMNNALDAIDGPIDDNEIAVSVHSVDGMTVLELRDTGCGIDARHREQIFNPFFTTKERGKGTGLGLSVCRELIEGVGGSLELDSEVDRGTTITIALPPASDVRPADDGPARPVASRRILVVDDDARVRRILARQLRSVGHEVVEADGGRAALEILARDAGFEAVLCDLMMPEVDGIAVCEQIRTDHPELWPHVALMSGGAYTERARSFLDKTEIAVLAKPFKPANLGAFVAGLARADE